MGQDEKEDQAISEKDFIISVGNNMPDRAKLEAEFSKFVEVVQVPNKLFTLVDYTRDNMENKVIEEMDKRGYRLPDLLEKDAFAKAHPELEFENHKLGHDGKDVWLHPKYRFLFVRK